MTEQLDRDSYFHKDWRIFLGLAITFIWLLLGALYISSAVGWSAFVDLPIDEMGTFLEGAFAPLAFLWLVIGLFIQQSVLAENNEELRRNNLHSEKQTLAIAATELNARQETFFKIAESTRRQLGAVSGMLFISSQGPVGNNNYSTEDLAEVWKQFAHGDFEVFSRMFLTMQAVQDNDMNELAYGTEIRKRHSENFIVGFDRLVKQAKECDSDNIILDSLIYSAHGLFNTRLRELHPDIDFEFISGTDTVVYLEQMLNS
ncbi:MAG: hypothetical protein QGG67_03390 [Gammaproteobacteria bacterium]|jgi:hypothetical protein|nr:hypothetical protein [Gammaproteobacteria bacterium]MDP6095032.1 hypothetical protein [Gammaproteobacteria bacterium]MDP7456011.1 hypothetical protein [Gammaproteobacteria bacterium]|tara:strand:+ start:901 stop:1677 length:777 start_codon:yes stop_codon:yes gene_type:complete